MLVSKAVELLGSSSSKEAKALSKSLQGLRLSELEIDVTSAKMEMQEELSQLRLLSEGTSFSSSSIPPAPGQAQGVPEVEVRKLKEKLASAERQIEGHKSSGGAGGAGGGAVEAALLAQLGDKDAKCAALEGELAGLRRQVAQLSKATEDDTSAKLSDQLAQAASNLALSATKAAQSQKDLESSGAKWGAEAKEWEGKLAAATALTASMTVEVAAAVAQVKSLP
ncbi:hypothetical protein B484DRAFT_220426 [Ochromonadaceae sp. CCMP2298]|nr:hypothetical protein B484DRAFT_220426 [Ochromonadaceae sp. CCMP2298]